MKTILFMAVAGLFCSASAQAQSISRFTVQAGYLQSISHLTLTNYSLAGFPEVEVGLPEVMPKPGFQASLTYTHQWRNRLIGGFETGYQNKGFRSKDYTENTHPSTAYNYLTIAPLVGVSLLKGFDVLAGPQLNVLLGKSVRISDNNPVEFGLMGKLRYQYHRFGLTAGYFRYLTVYYRSGNYYLTNQNWQVGLQYQLNRL